MTNYSSSSSFRHQKLILEYLGYAEFDKNTFTQEVERLANKYIRPKQILIAVSEIFKNLKMELPRYYIFADTITAEYNKMEEEILAKIKKQCKLTAKLRNLHAMQLLAPMVSLH
jgi:hypothetical protein